MNRAVWNIFNPGTYPNHINTVLLLLRITVGIFMLTHGIGKFTKLFASEAIQFHDPLGVGASVSLSLAVFAEFGCSILLILGLGTRLAALPLLFTMMVAIFIIHSNDGFGRQELPGLYAAIYVTIAAMGAGKYSVDYLIAKRQNVVI